VHFGIVVILNLGIGLRMPPVGPTMVAGAMDRSTWGGFTLDPGVLHPHADRASFGHLRSGAVALASGRGAEVERRVRTRFPPKDYEWRSNGSASS
jgi:hypothetical protein